MAHPHFIAEQAVKLNLLWNNGYLGFSLLFALQQNLTVQLLLHRKLLPYQQSRHISEVNQVYLGIHIEVVKIHVLAEKFSVASR